MKAAFPHVALHVRSLSACIAIYRDFCGLKLVHERGDPGGNAVEFSFGQPLGPGAEDMKP